MLEILERLRKEWPLIKGAPYSFLIVFIVVTGALWAGFQWYYSGKIEEANSRAEQWKGDVQLWKDKAAQKPECPAAPPTDAPKQSKPTTDGRATLKSGSPFPGKPHADQPTSKLECEGGNCAMSSGQQGGITAGQINFGPPPVRLTFAADETIPSTHAGFHETKVRINSNTPYTPVSLAVICDVPLQDDLGLDFGSHGMVLLNQRNGLAEDGKVAWFQFRGMSIDPDVPLYVHLWSKDTLKVLDVKQAKINSPPQ